MIIVNIITILLLVIVLLDNAYIVISYMKLSKLSYNNHKLYNINDNNDKMTTASTMTTSTTTSSMTTILPCIDIVTKNIHLVGIISKKKVMTKSYIHITIIPPRDSYDDNVLDSKLWNGISNNIDMNPFKIKIVIDSNILDGDSRVKEINRQLKVGQKIYVSGNRLTNIDSNDNNNIDDNNNDDKDDKDNNDKDTIYINAKSIRVLEDTELIVVKDTRKNNNDNYNNSVIEPNPYPITTLDLPDENVIIVNDLVSLDEMSKILFENNDINDDIGIKSYDTSTKTSLLSIIGVDCEWKPENYYNRFKRSANKPLQDNNDINNNNNNNNDNNKPIVNETIMNPKISKRAILKKLMTKLFRFEWLLQKKTSITESLKTNPTTVVKLNPIQYREAIKELKESSVESIDKNITKEEHKNIASPVALLQLATRKHVFIVDLQSICRQPESGFGYMLADFSLTEKEKALDTILFKIFQSEDIIKVGLGPTQDFKRLAWSYPWMPSMLEYKAVIDIQTLAKRAFPSVSSKDLEGLSKLSIKLLGKSVDKSMQCSDWSLRPLSKEQLDYASIDAHVQTKMFDILCFYSELSVVSIKDLMRNLCMNLVVTIPAAYKKSKKKSLSFTGKPLPLKVMHMQATPMSNSFTPKSILSPVVSSEASFREVASQDRN